MVDSRRVGRSAHEMSSTHDVDLDSAGPRVGSAADVKSKLAQARQRSGWSRVLRVTLLVLGVGLVILGGVAMVRKRAAGAAVHFRTDAVERRDIRVTVSATGKLQATTTVEVGAEVTAKVLAIHVDDNDRVTRGQVLAELDPEQLRAAAEEARAQSRSADSSIESARATLVEARQTRDRAEDQIKLGLVSQKDRETAAAAFARAQASLDSAIASAGTARAALKSAESRLAKTKIVAPIDGVVLVRYVEVGQTLNAGLQTPVLFKLAEDLTRLELRVDVDEADIGQVRENMGATFTVDAYPQRVFSSRVLLIRNEPKASQSVVTYEARLTVDNADRTLRPGMTASATITSELLPNVLSIPNAALRFVPPPEALPMGASSPTGPHVWVPGERGLIAVTVRAGPSDGRYTQLLGGDVGPDAKVVVDVVP